MDLLVDHPFGDRLAGLAVPAWCQGVWQRERLAYPGVEDREKRVIWIQTPLLFADLRSPPPGRGGSTEGFAGHLLVSGQICAWQRPLDVHPATGPGDAGAMYRDGDALLECGIHANYIEDWRLVAGPESHLAATRGAVSLSEGEVVWPAEGPLEILVCCGGHVIHAVRGGGTACLRYGRFDAASGAMTPAWSVGTAQPVAASLPWTVWHASMKPVARDTLLGSLEDLASIPG